jgi:hypothetical protein
MDEKKLDICIGEISADLSYVIQEVGKRGVVDHELVADDFDVLLSRKEFQDLVLGEIYEAYFLPDRHESDWLVLRELLRIVTSEHVRQFVASTVVGGVLGNTAFAVVRSVLARILSEMTKARYSSCRRKPFQAVRGDVDRLEKFFRKRDCARIAEIESSTGIPQEKLRPLLKLLGFKHYRREHACHWCRPGTTGFRSLQG